jgi:hypothetical protein
MEGYEAGFVHKSHIDDSLIPIRVDPQENLICGDITRLTVGDQ